MNTNKEIDYDEIIFEMTIIQQDLKERINKLTERNVYLNSQLEKNEFQTHFVMSKQEQHSMMFDADTLDKIVKSRLANEITKFLMDKIEYTANDEYDRVVYKTRFNFQGLKFDPHKYSREFNTHPFIR